MDKIQSIVSANAIIGIIIFLLPGHLLRLTLNHFLHRRNETDNKTLLDILLYSTVCWLPYLIYLSFRHKAPMVSSYTEFWIILIVTFVAPLILSFLLAFPIQFGIFQKISSKLGLSSKHRAPSAWDYVFQDVTNQSVWIIVRLKDTSCILGLFGNSSLAASDPAERDLYLQQVYNLDQSTGEWVPRNRSRGMLIKADQIALVELFE